MIYLNVTTSEDLYHRNATNLTESFSSLTGSFPHLPENFTGIAGSFPGLTDNFLNLTENVTNFIAGNVTTNFTGSSNNTLLNPGECIVLPTTSAIPWDNPDDLISAEVESFFDDFIAAIMLKILSIIGLPSNVMNAMVFAKQGLKERVNLCLFCLSLADLGYMAFSFFMFIEFDFDPGVLRKKIPIMVFLINTHLAGFVGLLFVSSFLTTVIALERCFCVLSPVRASTVLKTKTMLLLILVSSAIILAGFFIVSTRWTAVCVLDPRTGELYFDAYPVGEFYVRYKKFVDMFDGIFYGIVYPLGFVITVVIATVITIVKLRQMTVWREKASSTAHALAARDLSLTRMLIGCSILFTVCNIPTILLRLMIVSMPGMSLNGRYRNTFTFMLSCQELGTYINSSFNFFIYFAMSTRIKETLWAICGRSRSSKVKGVDAAHLAVTMATSVSHEVSLIHS